MPVYSPALTVYVDGVTLDDERLEAHTSHSTDAGVGTATVTLTLPRPAAVVFNKVVEIWASIGTEAARIFQGVIRADTDTLDEQGKTATLNCQGWGYILAMEAIADTVWDGPIVAREVIVGVLTSYAFGGAGEPQFEVPEIVDLDDTAVELGGNADVDAGQVRWEKGESGLAFIQRICALFGYAAHDCPDGVFRVTRPLGTPDGTSVQTFAEGSVGFRYGRSRDADPVTNWIEVTGAIAQPEDGSQPDPYSSVPASVPPNDLIPEPGAKYRNFSDDLLVSDALCDITRNILEVRYNSTDPATVIEWEDIGHPLLQPGQIVTVNASTVGQTGDIWLTSLNQDFTEAGYWVRYTGRRDTGTAMPTGGEVCTEQTLLVGPVHVGDETLTYYDVDAPSGTSINVDFTPADDFRSISITFEGHGCNSYLIGGGNTASDVSRYVLEQPVGTEIGSGVLPVMAENFGQPPTWQSGSVPIPGDLEGGIGARLKIISGKDNRLPALTDDDDFEIRNVVLRNCYGGTPTLPGAPSNPPIPAPTPTPVSPTCDYDGNDVTAPPNNPTILAAPWVWPQGKRYLVITGNVTGATGHTLLGGSDPVLNPAQSIYFATIAGPHPMIVPGTQDTSDPTYTGTAMTGSGAFECWNELGGVGGPISDQTITGRVYLHIGASEESGLSEAGCSISDACFQFQTTGVSP